MRKKDTITAETKDIMESRRRGLSSRSEGLSGGGRQARSVSTTFDRMTGSLTARMMPMGSNLIINLVNIRSFAQAGLVERERSLLVSET